MMQQFWKLFTQVSICQIHFCTQILKCPCIRQTLDFSPKKKIAPTCQRFVKHICYAWSHVFHYYLFLFSILKWDRYEKNQEVEILRNLRQSWIFSEKLKYGINISLSWNLDPELKAILNPFQKAGSFEFLASSNEAKRRVIWKDGT